MKRVPKQALAEPKKRTVGLIVSCIVLVVLLVAAFQVARHQTKLYYMEQDLRSEVRAINDLQKHMQLLFLHALYADESTFDKAHTESMRLADNAGISLPIYQTNRWFVPDLLERHKVVETEFQAVWSEFDSQSSAILASHCAAIATERHGTEAKKYLEYDAAHQALVDAVYRYQSVNDPSIKMAAGTEMLAAANRFQLSRQQNQLFAEELDTVAALDKYLTLPNNASYTEYVSATYELYGDGYRTEYNRCDALVGFAYTEEETAQDQAWYDQFNQILDSYQPQQDEIGKLLQAEYEQTLANADTQIVSIENKQ